MKFAPRAIIELPFINVMLNVYRSVLQRKQNEIVSAERYHSPVINQKAVIARLQPILLGIDNGRSGLDYEKTRLRILPYKSYSALSYQGFWLTGKTGPIIIVDNNITYHMGEYKVCIPVSAFESGSLNNIHFIPLKNPKARNRHPHHIAQLVNDATEVGHPLENTPRTCWGNYGAIITAIMNDGDIPELFRQLYIYLTRYNAASPLIHPLNGDYSRRGIQCVDFDTSTPWEEK